MVEVQELPTWMKQSFAALPDSLGEEISALSDDAASKALSKFRRGIGALAFSDDVTNKASIVEQYLRWDELIHTCYFRVPRFRKLVAYAVSTSDGFCASPAFKADAEYVAVAKWLEATQPTS